MELSLLLSDLGMLSGVNQEADERFVRNTFRKMDVDESGYIDFEEFKCLAAILPKREHAIYRGALLYQEVKLPKTEEEAKKVTPVQRDRIAAQEKTKEALNAALARLRNSRITTKAKITAADTPTARLKVTMVTSLSCMGQNSSVA